MINSTQNEKILVTFWAPVEKIEKLDLAAAETGKTRSGILRELITEKILQAKDRQGVDMFDTPV